MSCERFVLELERDLRESLRGGYLFGNFDEPLDASGMRIVRVIQQRLSDAPCECTDRTPDGARCRACGGRLYPNPLDPAEAIPDTVKTTKGGLELPIRRRKNRRTTTL